MARLLLLDIFQWFAILIGLTSYRFRADRLIQTRLTRGYTLIMNVILVALLPVVVIATKISWVDMWLPSYMWLTPIVLYVVNYAVIVQTLISRGQRDSLLMELHRLIVQLNGEMERAGKQMSAKLRRLFYVKSLTLTYLFLCYVLGACLHDGRFTLPMWLASVLLNNGYTILIAMPHLYFVSFWHVALGYDFVNQQLAELIATRSPLAAGYAEELRSLWSLHARLSRMAHKLNRIYGRQMLASRFDFVAFTIVNSYLGIIFSLSEPAPFYAKVYGALLGSTRTMDFLMTDYICDLVARYQSKPQHNISEGIMCRQLSSFVIYQHSMTLNLKVCGLFPVNRKEWLNMMGAILCLSVLLLQYHLMMSAKRERQ
ncbi:putative gustatory receptor 59b [Drosophila madeirensis]|uniref:Gustatory receptor n=1 Tax=Drosophila madeirensis TaxID=30013 RepID=A0AAU9GER3_DROMD